jgi:ABC-type lipoprotein export system ATPase subunit
MTVIAVKNLQKTFKLPEGGNSVILNVPRFELEAGTYAAIEGKSGSGKTTLLNTIAGIVLPDQGEVIVGGKNMAAMPEAARDTWRAMHIGYVFQTFNLLQGYSALENVALGMAFGNGIDMGWAKHLLERVGLSDRMDYVPRRLSVGQQQRVAVARALANKPQVVLADEPTGNLDPASAAQTLGLMQDICRENSTALLVVSHDQDILKTFKKVVKMSEINKA